jgi:hypothetical protein
MTLVVKTFIAIFLFCVLGAIVAIFFSALPDFLDLEMPLIVFGVFLFIISIAIIIVLAFGLLFY